VIPIGQAISGVRMHRGLTQKSLADVMGTTRQYVSKIERQKHVPSVDSIEQFSFALNVAPWRLFKYACKLQNKSALLLIILACSLAHAQTLQRHEARLQPESCYDRISKGREAFFDAARVSNNANTVDDLLSLYQQTSQPGTIRAICTNKRAADMFELKVAVAQYIARVGDAR